MHEQYFFFQYVALCNFPVIIGLRYTILISSYASRRCVLGLHLMCWTVTWRAVYVQHQCILSSNSNLSSIAPSVSKKYPHVVELVVSNLFFLCWSDVFAHHWVSSSTSSWKFTLFGSCRVGLWPQKARFCSSVWQTMAIRHDIILEFFPSIVFQCFWAHVRSPCWHGAHVASQMCARTPTYMHMAWTVMWCVQTAVLNKIGAHDTGNYKTNKLANICMLTVTVATCWCSTGTVLRFTTHHQFSSSSSSCLDILHYTTNINHMASEIFQWLEQKNCSKRAES